ncbi:MULTISPECIES: hypothetical protein [unclassified Bradyrhizobium]|uniref:hypothetical protein n=1 Tax=unclassified Bradyrhizobium TaxID=2631580 RepID=UPI0029166B2F|nr:MULTISPECIES: hypothetical protein [unclassified Bradyrhizobium]
MGNDLKSEQIGRIGERQFELLCERAGLFCNKSSVDVMGWDFIVEFPMESIEQGVTLDQRPARGVRIQLKSTLGRSGSRIRLSLSAIDRLAKDAHPAVIVVFRMKSNGELQSGYLVHLIGDELARVLRRLRVAEAHRAHDINHADIGYDFEKAGRRFEPTPAGLLEALTLVCQQSPAAYTVEKQRQLAELGYEQGRFTAEALIRLEGPDHLNDLLLGLVPLKPHQLQVFDNRFGIRLPYQGMLFDDLDELRLIPPTLGSCDVSFRGPGLGPAARFEAEMFIGPPISGGPELLIRHSDFTIRFTPTGLKFETIPVLEGFQRNLAQWVELTRALSLMATGRATITISGNTRIPAISLPADQPIDGPYLDLMPLISEFLGGWQRLLVTAGIRSTAGIDFDAFWGANDARFAVDLFLNPKPLARMEFRELGSAEPPEIIEGLYYNSCSFADVSLTYSVKVLFTRTDDPIWRYRSTGFQPLDVRPKVDDHEEYGADQADAHGLSLIVDPKSITMIHEPSSDPALNSSDRSQ